MPHARHLPAVIGLPLAVVSGVAIPLQSRINGALGQTLGDGLAAALISFGTGLVLMILISLLFPRGRAGLAQLVPAVRERRFPRIYLAAGTIGALFVFSQALTISLLVLVTPNHLLILLAVFGSLAAASLPLALGFGSVFMSGAGIYFLSQATEMSVFVTNVASMIGIGVAVDYSLFVLARYREVMSRGATA